MRGTLEERDSHREPDEAEDFLYGFGGDCDWGLTRVIRLIEPGGRTDCRSGLAGHPPPVVRWMDGDRILETSSAQHYSAQSPSERGEAVRVVDVTLHLPGLQRKDNGRDIKCVASNTNLTQEKVRVVTIDMYLPPLEVTVDGLDAPLRAGIEAILMCRSVGSLPTATLSWRLHGSSSLMPLPAQSSLDQNTTIGRGRLLPTPRDNGRALTCTASNPKVKEYSLNSTHTLQVLFDSFILGTGKAGEISGVKETRQTSESRPSQQETRANFFALLDNSRKSSPIPDYHAERMACKEEIADLMDQGNIEGILAPEVSVRLAPALDPDNIWEKADVYFECVIQANPKETRVIWLHEGRELRGDSDDAMMADHVLVQGQNLVLQRVTRHAQGRYQCRVTNTIDTVTSSATTLNVMFAPECKKPRNETVSVTPNEEVKLNCLVEANPPDVTFVWKINSSRGVKELDSSSYSSRSRSSTLVYRPSTHAHGTDHYGVVFCLGSNKAGKQRLPCMFVISPAGPPEKPKSCTLVNQSPTSLVVTCQPGHDGGLDQHFIATVEDAATRRVVANVTSTSPDLTVEGLAPGRDYLVKVTAVNQKGRSSPFTLEGFALKVAENKINNSSSGESSSLLVMFIAVVVGFVFILTILALATRARLRHRRGHPEVNVDKNKLSTGDEAPLSPSTNASLDEIGDGEMLHTPESHTGPLETLEITAQTPESPVSCSSRTYVPVPTGSSTLPRPQSQMNPRPQPLHSVDLPHVTSNNHKYYTLKINCTRQNNESFV
nr:nephrin-like [Penaeus vannamei]